MKTLGVYDCLVIPGAEKAASPFVKVVGAAQCGGAKGIVDAAETAATVCSKYNYLLTIYHKTFLQFLGASQIMWTAWREEHGGGGVDKFKKRFTKWVHLGKQSVPS